MYVGYFGAAAGVMLLLVLSAVIPEPLVRVNAIKNAVSGMANALAYVEGFSNYGGESVQVLNPGPNEQLQILNVTYKKQ